MNCDENKIPKECWAFIKKFPAFRFLKSFVFHVHQLYDRYPDGNEWGTFSFVISKWSFYGFDFKNKEWKKIGLSLGDLTWENILNKPSIPSEQIQSDWNQNNSNAKDYIKNKPDLITKNDLIEILENYMPIAPDDGKIYGGSGNQWVECNCGSQIEVSMIVNPKTLEFYPDSGKQSITVIISGLQDKTYTVTGIPTWASVTDVSEIGFSITVNQNTNETDRNATITITSNENSTLKEDVNIVQFGSWLSQFIFKVQTTSPDETPPRIVNLGAVSSGEAKIDWGDGSVETKPVNQSTIQTFQDPTPGGNVLEIQIGEDFTHTYAIPGEYTVTINTRNGVDAFRFATLSPTANNEWYSSGELNDNVTQIIKIQSDFIKNGRRLFSGVRNGWFDDNFVIETPNLESFDYMFEFFGVRQFSNDAALNDSQNLLNYKLVLPKNFWSKIADKTKSKTATRMYNGSGFLKLQRHMLGFSTELVSVIECFRGMPFVGNNWAERTGATAMESSPGANDAMPIIEEFLETDLFWDNPKISKFNGCFWFINDYYGLYPDSGYSVPLPIQADLFKNNTASEVDVSYMFKQANRAILEVDLFRHIRNSLVKMDGIFWGSFNYGAQPQIAPYGWLFSENSGSTWLTGESPSWFISPYQKDYRGATDFNLLFPEVMPNVVSMVAAFGWKFNQDATGNSIIPGMRGIYNGIPALLRDEYISQKFNEDWRVWTGIHLPNINLENFLSGKFPKVTSASGNHPSTGATVDGAFACFWDMKMNDSAGTKKAADYDTLTRQSILAEADMIDWGWGLSI